MRWSLFARSLVLAAIVASAAPAAAQSAPPQGPTWEQWLHLPGVFDLAGPRSDGMLVAAAHTGLKLISPNGATRDFAPAYSAPDGSEAYIALSPGVAEEGAGCTFAKDDLFTLDLRASPPGVTRVTPDGTVSHLATVTGVSSLTGITFDTVGDFGHRLLVIGPSGPGTTAVVAIGCTGTATAMGTVATALEGGIAVAPRGFGSYGGELIAANEVDGNIYAVSASAKLSTVAPSGVPAGADIGVESVGFVPDTGMSAAYVADRGTPGNPHPGTDSVLRLAGPQLVTLGAAPGDLLVATEGGTMMVAVHCAVGCAARLAASGPVAAHGEGRLLLVPAAAASGPSGPAGTAPEAAAESHVVRNLAFAAAAAAALLAATGVLTRRQRSVGSGRQPPSGS